MLSVHLWAWAMMGLHIAKMSGCLPDAIIFFDVLFVASSSSCAWYEALNRWTMAFPPSTACCLLYSLTSSSRWSNIPSPLPGPNCCVRHAARRRDTSWIFGLVVALSARSVSTSDGSDDESCRRSSCSSCSCRAEAAEWPFLKYS